MILSFSDRYEIFTIHWHYLRSIWIIWNFFIKQFITTIENVRFEKYLRLFWIQTYKIC